MREQLGRRGAPAGIRLEASAQEGAHERLVLRKLGQGARVDGRDDEGRGGAGVARLMMALEEVLFVSRDLRSCIAFLRARER